MSHNLSGCNSERTTVRSRRNRGLPIEQTRLKVTLEELTRSSPVSLSRPEELTKFSTMLGTSAESSSKRGSHLETGLQRYAVRQQLCKRQLCEDDETNQMIYVESQPPFDLRQGYGMQIAREDGDESMELLLRCMAKRDLVRKTDFACHQNLLTHLSVAPYELERKVDHGLLIVVQKMKGVFYMFKFPTHTVTEQHTMTEEKEEEMKYWGVKFESYVRAKRGQVPDPLKPLNLNNEFCSVVTRKVGQHSILFRGEIDGVGSDGSYMKLTINRFFYNEGHKNAFRCRKLIKWWLQCSMIGIKDIVCGFRDGDGKVQMLEQYETDQLPRQMLQCRPNVCMSFLDKFLSFVKSTVHVEGVPHVFQRNAHSLVFDMRLDQEGEYKFLPLWFVERVMLP